MDGLVMDYQLTIPAILRRAETFFGSRQVVSRCLDKSVSRCSYVEIAGRVRRLAVALRQLGIKPGDRVATLAWNHHQHLEAYFAIPGMGAVLHSLNLRLQPDELGYVASHAGDKVILVDASLLPLFERFRGRLRNVRAVIIGDGGPIPDGMLEYETLLAASSESDYREPKLRETAAASMCYTTGTTGRPKAVLYSHRALALHSLGFGLTFGIAESDIVLAVVPMFHANCWGLPYTAAMVGANLVLPGPNLDPASLAELCDAERVTLTAGVPTIWIGLLHLLDKNPAAYDLSSIRSMVIGGSAVPPSLIRGFERHGLRVIQAWGMTEVGPLGTASLLPPDLKDAPEEEQCATRARQGRPAPFIEIRARNEQGLVPWDGRTMGELEIRGIWVASAYYRSDEAADRFTADGWFRTGDIVTIDGRGFIELQDRAKDLIKSGGEWISSVALENALMGHPAVAEAAVIAVPHPKWVERPLAAVVLKEGQRTTSEELRQFLTPQFARWCLPDAIEFVASIPRTSAGKFQKSALREQFKGYWFPEAEG